MPLIKCKHLDIPCTVDIRHHDFLRRFKDDEEKTIPKLERKLVDLKAQLKQKMPMTEHFALKDEIKTIQRTITDLTVRKKQYFLNNSQHLFGYFEEKQKISEGSTANVKVLHTFFKMGPDTKQSMVSHANAYIMNVDSTIMAPAEEASSLCTTCRKGEYIPLDFEGKLICNNPLCSVQHTYLVEHEKPSYKDPPKEVCFYAYKRINHFREILAQFQAKECTQIPDDILQNIVAQIKKERIDIVTMTNKKTKEILKKFGYNKYYEHIPYIKYKLGIKPPVMPPEIEDKLCNLFIEIQRPYAKYCPPERVNFLNYYYTIYKLCEIIDETQFLSCFPMLKDREKRIEQDEIWKKICLDLNWEFIPTV